MNTHADTIARNRQQVIDFVTTHEPDPLMVVRSYLLDREKNGLELALYMRECPTCGDTFLGGKGRLVCRLCSPSHNGSGGMSQIGNE